MAETLTKIAIRYGEDNRSVLSYPNQPAALGLDGVQIGLRLQWLASSERWGLWLHALDESPMFGPALLVGGLNLWRPWQYDPRVPPGDLFVYSADFAPPSLTTADTEASLYYRSAL